MISASIAHAFFDGINFRLGALSVQTDISWPGDRDKKIITNDAANPLSGYEPELLFPVTFTFPETLMSSWSFRGFYLDFQGLRTEKDLIPVDYYNKRYYLYNKFFNDSDRLFADENPDWELSADIKKSIFFIGYHWGVFIPGKYYAKFAEAMVMICTLGFYRPTFDLNDYRVGKFGFGPAIFHSSFSYNLNLCKKYTSNYSSRECYGKTEIDSASATGTGLGYNIFLTSIEKYTKDSIWTFFKINYGGTFTETASSLKLKNHPNLNITQNSTSLEIFSYTKRF
jgi:hypothetical protein